MPSSEMEAPHRRRSRAGGLGLVAGVLVLAVCLPAAATRTVKIPSEISIHERELRFHGRVTSTRSACETDRRVTLYRRFSDGSHQALASRKTDASGRWRIRVSGFAGISMARFYAKAHRRSEGTAGTIYVCQRARSKTISFH
jgi:hypothetical protein